MYKQLISTRLIILKQHSTQSLSFQCSHVRLGSLQFWPWQSMAPAVFLNSYQLPWIPTVTSFHVDKLLKPLLQDNLLLLLYTHSLVRTILFYLSHPVARFWLALSMILAIKCTNCPTREMLLFRIHFPIAKPITTTQTDYKPANWYPCASHPALPRFSMNIASAGNGHSPAFTHVWECPNDRTAAVHYTNKLHITWLFAEVNMCCTVVRASLDLLLSIFMTSEQTPKKKWTLS